MKKLKVLQFPISNTGGGVTQYILKNWEFIDKERFQFDFATLSNTLDFENILTSQGCKLHYISCSAEKNQEQFVWEFNRILDEEYDAIHIHTLSWKSFLVEQIAKKRNVPMVIVHSHNTMVTSNDEDRAQAIELHEKQKKLFNSELATHFCACSTLAADWLFGEQISRDKIKIMKNAVDVDFFSYNFKIRNIYRSKLGLENCFVIGHIGRFVYQKNHEFLIDIFKQVCDSIPNARLMLIGTGELEINIRKRVSQYQLDDKVLFMGKCDDVNCLMQSMDTFVLPSRFEGLPIVLVEAQASGLKCLTSTDITREVEITDYVEFVPLWDVGEWVRRIIGCSRGYNRVNTGEKITEEGYNIRYQIKELEKLYLESNV